MALFSKEITGIDIGAGSIKVVRMRTGQRPKLLSAAIVEMPLDPSKTLDISTNLKYLLSGKHIGRGNVITQMPGKDLTIRSLTLPKMPQAELTEAVRWESKRHLSYSLDAALVEYLVVGEKQEGGVAKHDIVMVAAERDKVLELLKPFDDTAIRVSAVDANALALRNVLRLRDIPSDVNTLVVDIGAGKMEINIFKNGVLRFSRCVESGGSDMTRSVSESMGTGLMEAEEKKRTLNVLTGPEEDQAVAAVRTRLNGLLMEIRRSVEYYKTTFREKGVENTILTGGVSLMAGIKDYCAQSLDGPVEIDQPFERVACGKDLFEEFGPIAPRFTSAIGLALRRT
jgi:type IV pilus assembly protein PilM